MGVNIWNITKRRGMSAFSKATCAFHRWTLQYQGEHSLMTMHNLQCQHPVLKPRLAARLRWGKGTCDASEHMPIRTQRRYWFKCFLWRQRAHFTLKHHGTGEKISTDDNTSRENLFCGAPKYAFCGAWVVLHRIFATKISILWRTSTCATEIRNSVAHQDLMRHRIKEFCGAFCLGAPQN
jgi:hypothetical protein